MELSLVPNYNHGGSRFFNEEDLIIDLSEFITNLSCGNAFGYYFADDCEKIITGKVIDFNSLTKCFQALKITIPATEIPQRAVTLSFFVD